MSRFITLLLCLLLAAAAFAADVDTRVHLLDGANFGYYAPEIHEMFLRLPLKADPVGKDENFMPGRVLIDGKPVAYAFWYFDGHTVDYSPEPDASKRKIQGFVPIAWRANERHAVTIEYGYAGKAGKIEATLSTPATGGAWAEATGGNQALLIREEAGLARTNEPVDVDMTLPRALFPDPARTIRATIMTAPGQYTEIPVQVYGVEGCALDGTKADTPLVRFRATVQLTVKPKSETLVYLWSCAPRDPAAGPVRLEGGYLGGKVVSDRFAVQLDPNSGQLHDWTDLTLNYKFEYDDPRPGVEGSAVVIHRTPDVYATGAAWGHALDWVKPEGTAISGPLFVETQHWGKIPGVPQVFARVDYRFYAGRPEGRITSSMRVTDDFMCMGFRVGNMIFSPKMFTHAAWPRQDGSIARITIEDAYGNDMGAPPPGRFPLDTPWIAFYNKDTKVGFAIVTPKLAYFTDAPGYPNQARPIAYVSLYRGVIVYSIRSVTQTYCAGTRTYPTPVRAGAMLYEEMAYLPFGFDKVNDRMFAPVQGLYKELTNPLIVAP